MEVEKQVKKHLQRRSRRQNDRTNAKKSQDKYYIPDDLYQKINGGSIEDGIKLFGDICNGFNLDDAQKSTIKTNVNKYIDQNIDIPVKTDIFTCFDIYKSSCDGASEFDELTQQKSKNFMVFIKLVVFYCVKIAYDNEDTIEGCIFKKISDSVNKIVVNKEEIAFCKKLFQKISENVQKNV